MKKLLLITISSLKKKKANVVVLVFLVALAVMLLHMAISAFSYTNKIGEEKKKINNSADVTVVCIQGKTDVMDEYITQQEGYVDYESEEVLISNDSSVIYHNTSEAISCMICNFDAERKYQLPKLIKSGSERKKNSIVVPYFLYAAKNCRIGDKIVLDNSTGVFEYEIYGFYEDVFYSNPTNITIYKFYIVEEAYQEMETIAKAEGSTFFLGDYYKIKTSTDSTEFEMKLSKKYTPDLFAQAGLDYKTMSFGSNYFVLILMAIVLAFSFIIITVCLVVIRFTITSHIESNIKNLGALSSIGYTSNQLRMATGFEFLFISAFGGILGLVFSKAFSRFFENELSAACGLKWSLPYNFVFAIITYFFVVSFVAIVSYFSARKCKVITPLAALRNGIETHNYKKNKLPLEKTKTDLNTSLGLKSLITNHKQNIGVAIIIVLLTFTSLMMTIIGSNFSSSDGPILDVVGIEKPNVQAYNMTAEYDVVKQVFEEIEVDEHVVKVNYEYGCTLFISNENGELPIYSRCYKDLDKMDLDNLYKGKEPYNENEIAVSIGLADALKVKIGDIVYVKYGEKESKEFYVTGIIQQMNNLGKGARLSEKGLMRLDSEYNYLDSGFQIYLDNKTSSEEYVKLLNEKYLGTGIAFLDFEKAADSAMKSIDETFRVITGVLLILTAIIVTLITSLIIKMKIIKERRIMGVYKALGFTSKNLIYQSLISFIPIILIGAIIGAILSLFLSDNIFALCMASTGIKKVVLDINPTIILAGVGGITLLSLLITLAYSLRIRKIEAYKMIVEV